MNWLDVYLMPVNVGICLCVGFVFKTVFDKAKYNKHTVVIVVICGLLIALGNNGWNITPEIILSGMLSGLSSTGLHQIFKQYLRKGDEKK